MKFRLCFLIFFLFGIILASSQVGKFDVEKGKNLFSVENPISAKELAMLNPEIETISLKENDTIGYVNGYVNVFGGIGKNFILEPGKTYEIVSEKNLTLRVK